MSPVCNVYNMSSPRQKLTDCTVLEVLWKYKTSEELRGISYLYKVQVSSLECQCCPAPMPGAVAKLGTLSPPPRESIGL